MGGSQTDQQLVAVIAAEMAPFRGSLKRVEKPPVLWRFNGCGTALLGHLQPSVHSPGYFARLFFTVLWIPIIPLGIYLVAHPPDARGQLRSSSYEFWGCLAPRDFHRICRADISKFYSGILGQVVVIIGVVIVCVALVAGFAGLLGMHQMFVRFRL